MDEGGQFALVGRAHQAQLRPTPQLQLLHLLAHLLGPIGQPHLQLPETLCPKQLAQDLFPLVGPRGQEFPEAALRQDDHLPELLAREAQQLANARVGLPDLQGQGLALIVGRAARPVPQGHLRLLAYQRASATRPRELLSRTPADAIAAPAQSEVEHHLRGQRVRCRIAPHLVAPPFPAAGFAVEGEDHGVEDGRLAGARVTVDEKHAVRAQLGEVHRLLAPVGAESLRDQP